MKKTNLLIAAMLLMIATVAQAAEVVGKIGYMSGTLVAQRTDGTIKVMAPKSEVLAGDMLITAKDSYAQMQMNDGAQMTLRPHSNLKIEAFQFRKEEPQADHAVLRLLKGGFRTVTGLIGKRGNADAYRMHAASATIGIRGTDFSSRLCATPNCQDDMAASVKNRDKPQAAPLQAAGGASPPQTAPAEAPPGLYVTVHDGQVILTQAGKTLDLGRGETGFANEQVLSRLAITPVFMGLDKQMDPSGSGIKDQKGGGIPEGGCKL